MQTHCPGKVNLTSEKLSVPNVVGHHFALTILVYRYVQKVVALTDLLVSANSICC
jgi:hypothetical protein